MGIILECSETIQYDIKNIKESQFDGICIDNNSYDKIFDLGIKTSLIKICNMDVDIEKLNCKYILINPNKGSYEEYIKLGEKAKLNNIQVLFENSLISEHGRIVREKISASYDIATLIDILNEKLGADVFGVCLDVLACVLCAYDVYEFIYNLKGKVKAVRISGYDGYNRILPVPIGADKSIFIDWQGIIGKLHEINFDGELILDFSYNLENTSPILVKPMLDFAFKVGDYINRRIKFEDILKKYNSIVLFGAGVMFEVYMNYYGNKYSPIFVCDNNKNLWGTIIRGISVKPPEDLKYINEETGVVIANSMYSREIYTQLSDMGIKNIELFD